MFTDSEGSFTAKEPRVKVINVQQSGHRTDAVLNAMGQHDSESQPSAEIGKQNDGMMIIISNLELSYEQTIPIAEDYPQLVEKPMSNLPMPCKCAEGSNKCCIQNQNRFFPNEFFTEFFNNKQTT